MNRTTRSLTRTAAGEEFRESIEAPMQALAAAGEILDRHRDAPAERVRINVLEDAVELLLKAVRLIFVDRYPAVAIETSVINRMTDVAITANSGGRLSGSDWAGVDS